jgi:hypothetical protein
LPHAPGGLQNPEYLKAYNSWLYAYAKRIASGTVRHVEIANSYFGTGTSG